MRRVIHKVFRAWEFEKDEKWINEIDTFNKPLDFPVQGIVYTSDI